MPITRQAIVKHLASLAEAGLVSAEREGRQVRYRLTPGPLNEAMWWIAELGAEWDDRLQALERMLSSTAEVGTSAKRLEGCRVEGATPHTDQASCR